MKQSTSLYYNDIALDFRHKSWHSIGVQQWKIFNYFSIIQVQVIQMIRIDSLGCVLLTCTPTYTDVSENNGTPKSSILIGFSIINHPFWGTPIFGNTHIYTQSLETPLSESTPLGPPALSAGRVEALEVSCLETIHQSLRFQIASNRETKKKGFQLQLPIVLYNAFWCYTFCFECLFIQNHSLSNTNPFDWVLRSLVVSTLLKKKASWIASSSPGNLQKYNGWNHLGYLGDYSLVE